MKKIVCSLLIMITIVVINACRKDKLDVVDRPLYDEISESGYTYFQNGNLLTGVSPSPHGAFKLRFNSIAWAALDSTGRLPKGTRFPEGSILVKEVYENGELSLYVVMKKDPSSQHEGNEWLWAEYATDGSVDYSIKKQGQDCIGCHSGGVSRDLTRTFDLH
jgi:hypothetical protein